MISKASDAKLYDRIRGILDAARHHVARTVNSTQVVANWLIGREIVEDEQRGKRRAGYGVKLIAELSIRLTTEMGRGYSADNLEAFRQFYLTYPLLISETLSRKLVSTPMQAGVLNPALSWSHYHHLLGIDRTVARAFYEIETTLW